jgi:hypothetical protein
MTDRRMSSFAGPATLALALTAALFAAAPAAAQSDGNPGSPSQRRACTPDVYRLCAGEIPSAAKITACLRRKKAILSEPCRAVFSE